MQPVKKLEIILDAPEEKTVTSLLDRIGVSGYTILRNVAGKGGRGTGIPRLPSIEASRAVSSPQTNAPAPST